MMLNAKLSASQKQGSSRSPLKLKDLNVASSSSPSCCSSSSTTGSSISSDTPSGCLRFFLSHHSSTTKNIYSNKHKCTVANKTPNSAPNSRNLKENVQKKRSKLPNLVNFTTRNVKNNPHAPHPLKSKDRFSSRYDLSHGVNKFTSGFQFKLSNDSADVVNVRKHSSRYDLSDGINKNPSGFELKLSDSALNVRKPSSRYDLSGEMDNFSTGFEVNLSDSTDDYTSVNKLGCVYGSVSFSRNNEADNNKLVDNDTNYDDSCRSPTLPQVQVSVSPNIQGLNSVVAATPSSCYAAGQVLSGVTDKRNCRPKGILTIGNNNLFGSSKTKGFHNEGESVVGESNNRRDYTVPSPIEASLCWLSSPSDEKKSESCDDDASSNMNKSSLNQCEKLVPFELIGVSSSPSSSLVFSTELFDKSGCTISTTDTSIATPNSRRIKTSALHSDLSSEFRYLLGPSLDHLVRTPSSPSPVGSPTSKFEFLPEEGKSQYGHEKQDSPSLEDSLGSGNVMQTPESDSSLSNFKLSRHSPKPDSISPNFGLSDLSRDQISRLWFECELDSVAEVLRRVSLSPDCQTSVLDSPRMSFEFNPLIKLDNSIDFALFREAINKGTPEMDESDIRISWREGLASRMFEMDELDCCRYLSDEEDNVNGCNNASEFCSCPKIAAFVSNKIVYDLTASLQNEDSSRRKHGESPSLEGPKPCLESIDDDERYASVPEDSSWTLCYKNDLFQV